MNSILIAEKITKQFGEQEILKGIDLSILENTFTAILGPSGSGKSTLLNILSGLNRPSDGKVVFGDIEVSALSESKLADWKRSHVGNVFQNYLLLNNLTAEENIRIGIAPNRTPLSFDRLVQMLEIGDIQKKLPAQLSGGQQQRVAIARAVIKCPDLLFCDEATGALDEANSKKVVKLLHKIKANFGITILFTTHNQQIAKTANRIITIKDGLIAGDNVNLNPIQADEMVWG
ncbi:MAG: ABC transporter ATP-binding protein [Lachnospiraceae bacterium]